MRLNRISTPLALAAGALLVACQSEPGANASLETNDQKASYGIGLNLGGQLAPAAERLDMDALLRGLQDAMAEREPALTQEELGPIMQTFGQEVNQAQQEAMAELAEQNLAEGTQWLEENAEREGVTTTETGLQYEVLEEADGPTPGPTDQVQVHYRGELIDGTQFDSSYDRGQPATFDLNGGVIPGFSEGLQLMPVGSTYKLYIPARLAYGPQGRQAIEPNSVLIFEVEMLEIVSTEAQDTAGAAGAAGAAGGGS